MLIVKGDRKSCTLFHFIFTEPWNVSVIVAIYPQSNDHRCFTDDSPKSESGFKPCFPNFVTPFIALCCLTIIPTYI